MKTSPKGQVVSGLSFTQAQVLLMLCAIAETIEERRHKYSRRQRERLVQLHSQLLVMREGPEAQPDYAIGTGGAIVNARNARQIIVPACDYVVVSHA